MYVSQKVTTDGRTYMPGEYGVVPDNITPEVGEVTMSQQIKLIANYPGAVSFKKTRKKKATKKAIK